MPADAADDLLAAAGAAGAGAAVLRRASSFAWFTDGGDSRVDHSSESGVAEIVVTSAGATVVCDDIEAERLRDEQVPGFEVVAHPWTESADEVRRDLCGDAVIASDLPADGEIDLSASVASLRMVLDEGARERYRAVGLDARSAVAEVATELTPATREQDAAAMLLAALRRRGMFAPVLLVAGARRVGAYRHPIPTAEVLGDRAMLVVCAERNGLYANLTDVVFFEEPDDEARRRLDASEEILRRLRAEATLPGRTLGEIFDDAVGYYAEAGFPDEWRLHHQGGITGYATREVIARPGDDTVVRAGMAFAWNPSITGAKAEETFLLFADGTEVVTDLPLA